MAGMKGKAKMAFEICSKEGQQQRDNDILKKSAKEKIKWLKNQRRAVFYQIDNGTDKNGKFSEKFEIEYQFRYSSNMRFMSSIITAIEDLEGLASDTDESELSALDLDLEIPVDNNWSEDERVVLGACVNRWKHVSNWSFRNVESSSRGNFLKLALSLRISPTGNNVMLLLDKCVTSFDLLDVNSSHMSQRPPAEIFGDVVSDESLIDYGSDLNYSGPGSDVARSSTPAEVLHQNVADEPAQSRDLPETLTPTPANSATQQSTGEFRFSNNSDEAAQNRTLLHYPSGSSDGSERNSATSVVVTATSDIGDQTTPRPLPPPNQ